MSSALTLAAAGTMTCVVDDGPFEAPVSPFSWAHVRRVIRNRGFRLSSTATSVTCGSCSRCGRGRQRSLPPAR